MKLALRKASRRTILKGSALAGVAWLASPFLGRARAQVPAAAIVASLVSQAPSEPEDLAWDRVSPSTVVLSPQNIVLPRLLEAGAKELDVRALFDSDRLSLLLEWKDAHRDEDLGTVMQYRDAVAVQFPEDPAIGGTSFMMGQQGNGVTVYHWKSDWQFGRTTDVDEAYPNMYSDWYQYSGVEPGEMAEATDYLTKGDPAYLTAAAAGNAIADPLVQEKIGPIQKMKAEGFGTIEPQEAQDAQGKGAWQNGAWRIVISMPRHQEKFNFEEGVQVPLAFAVWDGSRDERNGQKSFSQWQNTQLGASPVPQPTPITPAEEGGGILGPLAGGIVGAIAVAGAAIIGLRMRRSRSKEQPGSSDP